VRLGAERESAEVAFEVGGARRGRGVGRLLVDALADVAAGEGIRRLHATVAPDNRAALALMRRLGRVEWTSFVDGAYEVVVAL
jgi:L-amino acid N-acyltransferase YncA